MNFDKIVKIGLGTAQIADGYGVNRNAQIFDLKQIQNILQLCLEAGVDTIDTSPVYGKAETILGQYDLSQFKVVTKIPPTLRIEEEVAEWCKVEVFRSLRHLSLQKIYGVLVHDPAVLTSEKGHGLVDALKGMRRDGLIEKIGVSIYDPECLSSITKMLKPDIVQAPVNLIDRSLERSGWLNRLRELGVEVHARSVFLQGLLLMDRVQIPNYFERWSFVWDIWERACDHGNFDPVQACLSYPLSLDGIDKIIIGVESIEQFSHILSVANLSEEAVGLAQMEVNDKRLVNPANWSAHY